MDLKTNEVEETQTEVKVEETQTENAWLPKNYSIPSKSEQFMHLKNGQNKFRVLSNPVRGFLIFSKENDRFVPCRKTEGQGDFTQEELEKLNIREREGKKDKPKHFWLMVVWDYAESQFRLLELTQKRIKDTFMDYFNNEDFGDPRSYDITIDKKGESLSTDYSVIASPPKEFAHWDTYESVKDKVDLNKIFKNEYPFQEYPLKA